MVQRILGSLLLLAGVASAFLLPSSGPGQQQQRQCLAAHRLSSRGAVLPAKQPTLLVAPLQSSISDFLDDADVDSAIKDPAGPGASSSAAVADDGTQYFVRCGRCNAAYAVSGNLVGAEGGRVKCEVCGHTWFQAANRLQVLSDGYILKEYPNDLRAKVEDNVKHGRHPLDTAGQKGAISVFIGNLPFSMSEEDIKGMFGEFGGVVAVTIVKDQLNRSKGFGFVEMAVKEEGEAAIAGLDGREIDGRPINVRLGTSKPQPRLRKERTKQARGDGKDGGAAPAGSAGAGDLSSLLEEDD